ncbi:hypothetical protein PL9631_1060196 [Planktothrix paucivesiculata PCC 9631]|uniref:Uncharacterized protein n=1 Tax=Planktothrix paucivesiculata PCC 9631 TaxID=671071 RepID=A0A7Z9DWN0_9CYAN|nr:hypothetical protein PL9631_1060196 [Planktothrix paucivesiculata PCC 9631]
MRERRGAGSAGLRKGKTEAPVAALGGRLPVVGRGLRDLGGTGFGRS